MHHRLVGLLLLVLLAGCTAPNVGPAASSSVVPSAAPTTLTLHGVVVDAALHPLPNATTTVLELHRSAQGATFRFPDVAAAPYTLTASAAGFHSKSLVVSPAQADQEIRFVLDVDPAQTAYNVTTHFHGSMQCALEAGIISPSCDTLVTAAGGPQVTPSNTSTILPVDAQWRTVVADVVFDASKQPGLQGLRVTVQGTSDQSELGTYQQYGRFNGTSSFTFHLEPGGAYPEGIKPVPTNTTQFRFDVYPQSLGWHATCQPPAPASGPCLLGAGAGTDVEFDLYLTTFYGRAAPAGFTLRH